MSSFGACSIEGCESTGQVRRGWCVKHYERWRAHGDPLFTLNPGCDGPRPCSIIGCDRVVSSLDMCEMHYGRTKRTGSPHIVYRRKKRVDVVRLFWSKVDVGLGCWEWSRERNDRGYGVTFVSSGRTLYAHRVAYALTQGPIPAGMVVMHSCDNPPCCNPSHLNLGTHAENAQDMYHKGRWRNQYAEGPNAVRTAA